MVFWKCGRENCESACRTLDSVADYLPGEFNFDDPGELEFLGDSTAAGLFDQARERLKSIGGTERRIDFSPFLEAARLLYEGPWVAERYVATRDILDSNPDTLHPITRKIIAGGVESKAHEAFSAAYKLQACKQCPGAQLAGVDFVLTPTTGTIYTTAEGDT